jgi:histidinol-phosphatase (PHP family)
MPADDMPDYLTEINRLKEKYKDRLEIYAGLEIDYLDETYNPSIPYFRELPLDYRIGSVHFLPVDGQPNMVCIDGAFPDYKKAVDTYFSGDLRKLVKRFYYSTMQMVESGGIDIVGHIDKVYMNGEKYRESLVTEKWYQDMFAACLDLIAEKGIMVEINTKILTSKNKTFPHLNYLPLLLKRNIPVVVNSDCHTPDLVNDGRPEALNILKKIGFRSARELIAGKWEEVTIKQPEALGKRL